MSEPDPVAADNIAGGASSPQAPILSESEAADLRKKRLDRAEKTETLTHLIWLGAAIVAPFLFICLTSHDSQMASTVYRGLRLGVTSFFIALAVLGLGQIDTKFTSTRLDATSSILASLLGMMLWLVWVGSGQMIYKAVDETKSDSEQGHL